MYELLIVDDEINSRDILVSCFPWENLGFHVCGQVSNGQEALDFLHNSNQTVHVIFTDIEMPVMDGIALAKEIHHMPDPKPLVIFLSAHDDFQFAQKAIKYNVRYYALKPSSFSELNEVFTSVRNELELKFQYAETSALRPVTDETIQKVMDYCMTNYREGSLTDLAQKLSLNVSYLSQLIRQKTDRTFSDFLLEAKMRQAELFLQDPKIKVYHISSLVGYTNPNNFSRAFNSYYNMTPSEYRILKSKGTKSYE